MLFINVISYTRELPLHYSRYLCNLNYLKSVTLQIVISILQFFRNFNKKQSQIILIDSNLPYIFFFHLLFSRESIDLELLVKCQESPF